MKIVLAIICVLYFILMLGSLFDKETIKDILRRK